MGLAHSLGGLKFELFVAITDDGSDDADDGDGSEIGDELEDGHDDADDGQDEGALLRVEAAAAGGDATHLGLFELKCKIKCDQSLREILLFLYFQ